MAEQTRLGGVLDGWIKRQRVTQQHIADVGGVSRNTLALILNGTTARTIPDTLRKISRALATDPHVDVFDRSVYIASLRDLTEAAGLPDLTQEIPPCDLETEIRIVVKDSRRARVLTEFIRRYPEMDSGDRRLVDSVLDRLDQQK